jgi:hypothetical protein
MRSTGMKSSNKYVIRSNINQACVDYCWIYRCYVIPPGIVDIILGSWISDASLVASHISWKGLNRVYYNLWANSK